LFIKITVQDRTALCTVLNTLYIFRLQKLQFVILIIDDDKDILTSARLLLKQHFSEVDVLQDPVELNSLLSRKSIEVILLDMNYSKGRDDGKEGLYWLQRIKEVSNDTQVIMMTAYGEIELAVKAIKKGAFDFVLKPWTNEALVSTINNAINLSREKRKVKQLEETKASLESNIALNENDFITRSSAMKEVMKTIDKVAATDANILLLGENGTGKSVLALAIHQLSARRNQPFISVDLGALNENLFESELFGHKKGAFTDAHQDKAGRFEVADKGTLFLDEIGNLSLPLQAKLLSSIQSKKISRLGDHKERNVDVRLICATNMPLYEMVSKEKFRQDLLYRINTVEIKIPPLRERRNDIPILSQRFLQKFARKYQKNSLKLSPQAFDRLAEYHWPGNIRELEHTIERAVILADNSLIDSFNLQLNPEEIKPEGLNLLQMEKYLIQKAMDKYKGNISRAAKELGLTRAALYRRLEKHGF